MQCDFGCFQGQKVRQDDKDFQELEDSVGPRVLQVQQVQQVQRENVDQRDLRVLHQAHTVDNPVIEVLQVFLELEGQQVHIKHVYVVFSSAHR